MARERKGDFCEDCRTRTFEVEWGIEVYGFAGNILFFPVCPVLSIPSSAIDRVESSARGFVLRFSNAKGRQMFE